MPRLARPALLPGFLVLLASLLPATVLAAPTLLDVQGVLRSAGGGPVTDGDYGLTVRFYDQQVGGNELYSDLSPGVKVQGGFFSMAVGVNKPLDTAPFLNGVATWVGVSVGSEPELARAPLRPVPYALRATVATQLLCSGCIGLGQLDPALLVSFAKKSDLAGFANAADLAAYAKKTDLQGLPTAEDLTGYAKKADLQGLLTAVDLLAYAKKADLAGFLTAADLAAFVKKADLANVALSGKYSDLAGGPDLSGYVKAVDLAKVATSGTWADLGGKPAFVQLGTACGSGLFVRGFKADGSLECGAPSVQVVLPPDGLAAISNGAMTNVFTTTTSSATAVPIPDNSPIGASAELIVPDVGAVQVLAVHVILANSDISTLTVKLFDAKDVEYVLHDKSGSGGKLDATYPKPTVPATGDLGTWIGKNPAGKWRLHVVDGKFFNNSMDGQITSWSITVQAMSGKNVEVKGDAVIDGAVLPGAFRFPLASSAPFACTPAKQGFAYVDAKTADLWMCRNGTWQSAMFHECGNGVIDALEQCDDGPANANQPGKCRTTCVKPACGDKILDPNEACDDGNNANGDGCESTCQLPCVGGWIYKGVCLKGAVLAGNGEQVPNGCTPYQPGLTWGQAEYLDICNHFSPALGKSVTCAAVDTDADGGLCANFQALLSCEANTSPDIWMNNKTFNWSPKNGANCNIASSAPSGDIVVYACK